MKTNKLFMYKIIIWDDCGYCDPTHFAKIRMLWCWTESVGGAWASDAGTFR